MFRRGMAVLAASVVTMTAACTAAGDPMPAPASTAASVAESTSAGQVDDGGWTESWVMERLRAVPATDATLTALFFNDARALDASLHRSEREVPAGVPLWTMLQTAGPTCDRPWQESYSRARGVAELEVVAEPGRRFEIMIGDNRATFSACRGGWVGELDSAQDRPIGGVPGQVQGQDWFGRSGDDLLAVGNVDYSKMTDGFVQGTAVPDSLAENSDVLAVLEHTDQAAWVLMGQQLHRSASLDVDPPPFAPEFAGVGWVPNSDDDLGLVVFVTSYRKVQEASAVATWLNRVWLTEDLPGYEGAIAASVGTEVIARIPNQDVGRFSLRTLGYQNYPALVLGAA